MFTFGWLTITADDLAIWKEFPNAAFTLYSTAVAMTTQAGGASGEKAGEEFRLAAFEPRSDSNYSEGESDCLRTIFSTREVRKYRSIHADDSHKLGLRFKSSKDRHVITWCDRLSVSSLPIVDLAQ
jgi:hypothetical protein